MSLTRDQILAARKLPSEKITIPEWGGDVWVRVMSGSERDEYETQALRDPDTRLQNMRAKLLVRCLTDEAGNLLFSPEDAAQLAQDSWLPLQRATDVAQRINKLSNAALEELKGNSKPSPGAEPS